MNLGEKIINFNLLGVDDSYHNLDGISNKKIVVFFTCNHCPYVHAYENRIIKMQEDFIDTVYFIGINSNDDNKYPEDSFENMKIRSNKKKYNFLYLRDDNQEVAKLYQATHTPHFFLFGTNKTLIYKGKFDDSWDDEASVNQNYLKDAIQNKNIKLADTFPVGCSIKWL